MRRLLMFGFALGLLAALDAAPAAAQSGYAGARGRDVARNPTRVIVTPGRRLVRECEDWYALENRPSGPVITPQMRCRWAYR